MVSQISRVLARLPYGVVVDVIVVMVVIVDIEHRATRDVAAQVKSQLVTLARTETSKDRAGMICCWISRVCSFTKRR